MACLYEQGNILLKDYKKSFELYKLAAEDHSSDAQLALARYYSEGRAVPKNSVRAYEWYSIAATSGYEKARNYRDRLETEMDLLQVERAQELAQKLMAGTC